MKARKPGRDDRLGRQFRDPKGRTGILTDILGRTAYLRPERGGREWPVPIDDVEPVSDQAQAAEELSAKVAQANGRGRWPR